MAHAAVPPTAAPFYDEQAPVCTLLDLVDQQIEDCCTAADLFEVARMIPRRLGQDATPAQLSRDKKASRSLAYAYGRMANSYMGVRPGGYVPRQGVQTNEAKRLGAQVDIQDWCTRRLTTVQARGTLMVTQALRDGERKLANVLANFLGSEQAQLTRTLDRYGD